jgi:hypothetical protein
LKAGPARHGAGPAVVPIKKKQIADPDTTTTVTDKPTEPATDNKIDLPRPFETAPKGTQTAPAANQPKTTGQKRNELINDPAVRTVLMGLDATITGIDEDQQGSG